jgi:sulfite exporter TauE/SafE
MNPLAIAGIILAVAFGTGTMIYMVFFGWPRSSLNRAKLELKLARNDRYLGRR